MDSPFPHPPRPDERVDLPRKRERWSEQKLSAYRDVADQLWQRIRRRFAKAGAASG
nr:hypothetical protein [Bradyrhizobium sp.]